MRFAILITSIAVVLGAGACSLAETDAPPAPSTSLGADRSQSAAASPAASGDPASTKVDPRRGGFDIAFGEFAITLESAEIRPGPVTFVVRNGGELVHGFEMEIEDQDSSGHGSGDGFKLEGRPFGPGETVRFRMELSPGVYEIECFVAEHDDMGMRTTLVVRPGAPLVRVRPPATDGVEISDFAFAPRTIEAAVGDEVTWTNLDPAAHTVSARDGSFDSGRLEPDAAFRWTFERPGTYAYRCRIHPTMEGTVRVVPTT